jgi:hypothetical protein
VYAGDLLALGARRLAPFERRESFRVQGRQDRFQPRRAFGVPAARVVLEARRMSIKDCGHETLHTRL